VGVTRLIWRWAGVTLVALCSACQVWQVQPAAWQANRDAWGALPEWQASGRFALRYGDTNEQGVLVWRQQGPRYTLLITSPWAQGGVQLEASPQGAQLRTEDGQLRYGDDADALLAQYVGWQLPVSALGYWLRALPQPNAHFQGRWDAHGRLTHLHQHGWDIAYTRYDAGGTRPTKLVLTRTDLEARLVIDEWAAP